MIARPFCVMPGSQHGPSIKNPKVYDALRRKGMSKSRAARISNAQVNKDAGVIAGAPLSGPGGLLGTPGLGRKKQKSSSYPDQSQFAGYTMEDWDDTKPDSFYHDTWPGRKWGNRTKDPNCTCGIATKGEQIAPGITRIRGNLCNVHGRYGLCPGAKPTKGRKGGKGRKPAKPKLTPEQRAADRSKQQAANRAQTLSKLNIAPDGQQALEALRNGGQPPDPSALARGGFEKAGIVERAQDGSYRLTASGRAALAAASQGDVGRAGDTISAARDRLGARKQRQSAAAQRKQAAEERRKQAAAERAKKQAARASGGGKQGSSGSRAVSADKLAREAERQADRKKRQQEHDADRAQRLLEHAQDRNRRLQEHAQDRASHTVNSGQAPRTSGSRPSVSAPTRAHGRLQVRNTGTRAKAETYGGVKRSKLDDDVFAGPDRSFPIKTAQDVRDAVRSLGRTKHDKDAVRRGIIRRARAIGATDALPDSWKAEKSFTVFKSADGSYRWLARSTTAYRDRDGEIITTKSLEQDAARMTATQQYGPLRYWHLGQPDPFSPTAPWGIGVDIGDCDYSTVIGRTSIESGTFRDPAIGQAFAQSADDYELSPGFFHPIDQPNAAGEYDQIRRFERSVVPVKYGRASNLFTGMTVKEHRMDQQTYEQRMKAFAADMNAKGVPPEVAGSVVASMEQADKSAQEQGIAYKSDDAPTVFTAPDGTQGIIADGHFVALKAMAPASMEQAGATEMADGATDQELEDGADDETAEQGDYIGDMSVADFEQMLATAFQTALAPLVKGMDISGKMAQHMSELKDMMGGYATKDAGTASEIATLKARLAELEGSKPNIVQTADIEAALKSTGPQAPPDPSQPQLPADATPIQRLAAQTMPALYQTGNNGQWAGWQPPNPLPQS